MKTLFMFLVATCASCATIKPRVTEIRCEYLNDCICKHATVYARYSYMKWKKEFYVLPDSIKLGDEIKQFNNGWIRIK